jgi:hypothetical protein
VNRRRLPVLQVLLAGVAAFALAAGGTATFQGWGRVPVRPLAQFLLVGAALHAASRYARPGYVPRALAWVVWAVGIAFTTPLSTTPVLGALAAAGLLDLAFHGGDAEPRPEVGSRAVGAAVARAVTSLLVGIGAARLAGAGADGARLAATALAGGGLVAAYALRARARTPGRLLAGALAFGIVFRVLAAPILPLGPILAYWVLVGAAVLALAAGTRSGVRPGLPEDLERHDQVVERKPDPLDRGLESALRSYLAGTAAPRRVRRAVARHDPDLADELADDLPGRDAPARERVRVVSDRLDVRNLEELR